MTFIFNYLILVLPSNFTVSGIKKSKKYLNLILNAILFLKLLTYYILIGRLSVSVSCFLMIYLK